MPSEITPFEEPPLIPSNESLAAQAKVSGGFVPTIKLLQTGSGECKTSPDEFRGGQYLIDDVNLTDRFRATVIAQRDHALRFVKNQKDVETYDKSSSIWQDIKKTKNNFEQGINAILGTEWLLWLNEQAQFATFHAGKSATLDLTKDIVRILQVEGNRQITMYSTLKSWGTKYSAFGARAVETKPEELGDFPTPTQEQLDSAKELFYAPVRAEVEMVEVDETD